jgi:hypothetical protein
MPDSITSQLAAMLDSDTAAAEGVEPTFRSDNRATVEVIGAFSNEVERTYGSNGDSGLSRDWPRSHPEYCTGRGPTGRLRNFRAMNWDKFHATYHAVRAESNDPEAMEALQAQYDERNS